MSKGNMNMKYRLFILYILGIANVTAILVVKLDGKTAFSAPQKF